MTNITEQENICEKEAPPGFRVVKLNREPIELYKILKFESMVGSGGEARVAVASGQVILNGEIETQKRKKIVAGDTIEFGEEKIFIKLAFPASDAVTCPKIETKPATNRSELPVISKGKNKK